MSVVWWRGGAAASIATLLNALHGVFNLYVVHTYHTKHGTRTQQVDLMTTKEVKLKLRNLKVRYDDQVSFVCVRV